MNNTFINGISLCTGNYTRVDNIIENYLINNELKIPNQCINLVHLPKNNLIRKMDRFSKLFLQSSIIAASDAKIYDFENIGTIFNSVFGPIKTNLEFSEYINKDNLEGASPKKFVNTVNNACVGYTSIILGCKGISTMFLMSDHIGFGIEKIRNETNTLILSSGEENIESISKIYKNKGIELIEINSSIILSNSRNNETYSELLDYKEFFLDYHPFFNDNYDISIPSNIISLWEDILKKNNMSFDNVNCVIFTSPFLQDIEVDLIKKKNYDIQIILFPFECLSSSSSTGISIASSIAKSKTQGNWNCLVTSLNYSGGYNLYLIRNI